jgi:hypothetical protein
MEEDLKASRALHRTTLNNVVNNMVCGRQNGISSRCVYMPFSISFTN